MIDPKQYLESVAMSAALEVFSKVFPDGPTAALISNFHEIAGFPRNGNRVNGRHIGPPDPKVLAEVAEIRDDEPRPKKKQKNKKAASSINDPWDYERWDRELYQWANDHKGIIDLRFLGPYYNGQESALTFPLSRGHAAIQKLVKRGVLKHTGPGMYEVTAKKWRDNASPSPEPSSPSLEQSSSPLRTDKRGGLLPGEIDRDIVEYAQRQPDGIVIPADYYDDIKTRQGKAPHRATIYAALEKNKQMFAKRPLREGGGWRLKTATEAAPKKRRSQVSDRNIPGGGIRADIIEYAKAHDGIIQHTEYKTDYEQRKKRKLSNSSSYPVLNDKTLFEKIAPATYQLKTSGEEELKTNVEEEQAQAATV